MTSEKYIELRKMIETEFAKACTKHPKFCDQFTNKDIRIVRKTLNFMRIENSESPFYADRILYEEIAEAIEAYLMNDREHCIQELAQCGAVILRMMLLVSEEMENAK